MVLDSCEMCGMLCDFSKCAYWGTCDDCWFNVPSFKVPARVFAKKEASPVMDDFDRGVVLDPCMECGKSCDYARCNVWGVCNGCWQDLMDTDFTPARIAAPAKKELSDDDKELMEILL